MLRPQRLWRGGALTLAAVSLLFTACTNAASPALTFSPAPATPTAAPSPVASVPPSAAAVAPIITLSEWKVATARTFKAGTVDFTITNAGTTAHELLVFKSGLKPAAYPTDPAGIVEEGAGVDLLSDGDNIDPSGTQTRSVDLTAGTYLFVCNIPGHFKSGMFTVVTVTP